jgi:glucose/arabinose dehydrogenase
MVYQDSDSSDHYAKVVRFQSTDGGLSAASEETILDIAGEAQGHSHQISNVTIGPDGLYVHNGDGFLLSGEPQDIDSFRGKVLRMTLDGDPVPANPVYDAADQGSDGLPDARDYVFAYGFRNPFGGAWRAADGAHYEVENGPFVDRFARVQRGVNYGWDGTDESMTTHALYNWLPAHAPLNIAFVEPQTASGSGFPAEKMGHAFVTETGPTYAAGPQPHGKRIVEFAPTAGGGFGKPAPSIEYTGTGRATAAGLAAGPDGLYFTDLYKDQPTSGDGPAPAIAPGAKLLRVRYVGAPPPDTTITKGPRKKVRTTKRKKRARFRFTSTRSEVSFECKVDKRAFKPCASPRRLKLKTRRRRFEKHKFLVRAKDSAGTDPTPARHRWKLKRRR